MVTLLASPPWCARGAAEHPHGRAPGSYYKTGEPTPQRPHILTPLTVLSHPSQLPTMVRTALFPLLALTASLSSAQNCPFLGPVYHADISASAMSDPLKAATAAFDKAVDKAMAEGRIDGAKGFWGIDIYAAKDEAKKSLYSRYYTATAGTNRTAVTVGPDTVFRAFSISKLITVYTFLAAVGDERWHEPITKYVPELAKANKKWAPERGGFNWDEVTLGSLAGQISGLAKDCRSFVLFPYSLSPKVEIPS
jgi:CubicO group peptidase (beta-lactamase class C family)